MALIHCEVGTGNEKTDHQKNSPKYITHWRQPLEWHGEQYILLTLLFLVYIGLPTQAEMTFVLRNLQCC